jgi:hypothetical protein
MLKVLRSVGLGFGYLDDDLSDLERTSGARHERPSDERAMGADEAAYGLHYLDLLQGVVWEHNLRICGPQIPHRPQHPAPQPSGSRHAGGGVQTNPKAPLPATKKMAGEGARTQPPQRHAERRVLGLYDLGSLPHGSRLLRSRDQDPGAVWRALFQYACS